MKMIKLIGIILAIVLMVGFNSSAFSMDYDTLTAEQKASVTSAATLVGESDARTHYENNILEELSKVDAKVRRARESRIMGALGSLTDDQLAQIEAIINP